MKGFIMSKYYVLPNDSETTDSEHFIEQWNQFAQVLTILSGTELIAFDPELTLIDNDTNQYVDIPGWFVKRINENLQRLFGVDFDEVLNVVCECSEYVGEGIDAGYMNMIAQLEEQNIEIVNYENNNWYNEKPKCKLCRSIGFKKSTIHISNFVFNVYFVTKKDISCTLK